MAEMTTGKYNTGNYNTGDHGRGHKFKSCIAHHLRRSASSFNHKLLAFYFRYLLYTLFAL